MRIPLSWLEELVAPLPGVDALLEVLPGLGLGVEAVHELPAAPAGVVVAEIGAFSAIEGSEHLLRVAARDGRQEREVVCGAPNVRSGARAVLAPPGTRLPDGTEVEEREMLGVRSGGMLCSPRELGLFDHAGGLLLLGDDAPLGAPLAELWPAETVLELELTPNRADAFSLLGVARDLAAKLDLRLRDPAADAVPGDADGDDGLELEVRDREGCPHLVLQRVDGLEVGPSPVWMQRRLAALGLRPRNNVVDVTNYVTFELGQPSHAYDLRVLDQGVLQVRRADPGERVTLLSEATVALDPADLVIAAAGADGVSAPIGLAGVMGGLHDSVREDSDAIALEAAHFDPVSVRATAKRHGLSSDAHYRFERGVDPALPPRAVARAARLIAELGGGRVHPAVSRTGGFDGRPEIAFRPGRVAFLTTMEVPFERQREMLEALGCEVRPDEAGDAAAETWRVRPPSWRFDLSIEEDLIEEVARLHGYEHLGATSPAMPFTPPETDPTHRGLREWLAAAGVQEVLSYVFTSDDALARAAAPAARVRLSNPQGAERSVLRTALHPGLLQAAANNRGAGGLALFEVGRVFLEEEHERVAMLFAGSWDRGVWQDDAPADLWRVKGLLERLAEQQRSALRFEPADAEAAPMLHPGVAARVQWNGRDVGLAGRVHPEIAAAFELEDPYLVELELPLESTTLRFRDVERQPYAERDLAVVAPTDVPYARLEALVRDAAGELLREAWPFDVYAGAPLEEGTRSVALRLRFRHPERALTDEEVDARMSDVMRAVHAAGYAVRG